MLQSRVTSFFKRVRAADPKLREQWIADMMSRIGSGFLATSLVLRLISTILPNNKNEIAHLLPVFSCGLGFLCGYVPKGTSSLLLRNLILRLIPSQIRERSMEPYIEELKADLARKVLSERSNHEKMWLRFIFWAELIFGCCWGVTLGLVSNACGQVSNALKERFLL